MVQISAEPEGANRVFYNVTSWVAPRDTQKRALDARPHHARTLMGAAL